MLKPSLFVLGLLAGCAFAPVQAQEAMPEFRPVADPAPRDPSLEPVFRQFGGKAGLQALVDQLMVNNMANPVTRPFFVHADREHVKAELVDQFCTILGGPCSYTGKNMEQAHRGMNIRRDQFNALVENLQKAMDARGIPFRAQNKLLAKLAPMHREIVTK